MNYSVKLTVGLIEQFCFNSNKKIILKEKEGREEKKGRKEAGKQERNNERKKDMWKYGLFGYCYNSVNDNTNRDHNKRLPLYLKRIETFLITELIISHKFNQFIFYYKMC